MSLYQVLLLCCYLLAEIVVATKHGTIGYGINMFHPYCCSACSDSLAMVYLNCTTFSESNGADGGMSMKLRKRMDMDMAGTTSDECHATNRPYLETLAYCVQSHCDAEGISDRKQDSCFQRLAAGGVAVPSLANSLPTTAPTEELAEDAMWLNKTMLVNEVYWMADRGTIDEFETSEEYHVRFSIIILTLSVGIPMLAGLWLWMTALIPPHLRQDGLLLWTQSNFTLPALLGKRHSQPLPFKIGYVPNRGTSILIAIYVILNIIFCSAPYNSVQPSSWFSNRNEEMAAYIANRTGVLSFANMALAILFSTRNNPLMYLSGWSQTTFLAFHRWAARIAILQAVIHSIVYTADYCYYRDGGNAYFKEAALPYFWWGIIATTAMGLMAGLSALPLRSHAYELFLVLHIILAILSLMGSWYHVDIRFSKKWGYEIWLYIAFAFWAWDRLVRLLKVAYYNLPTRSSAHAELIPGTDAIMLTIFPGRGWAPQPGQHTFLYFPSLKRFWENHPFTILDWGCSSPSAQHDTTDSISTSSNQTPDKEAITNKNEATVQAQSSPNPQTQFYIRCLFRAHKGTTSTLHTSLLNHPLPTLPTFSEGPYGTLPAPTKSLLRHADKILCIAGGIGITFATGFVKQFAHERSLTSPSSSAQKSRDLFPRCKEFVLAWTVREPELLDCGRERFLPALEAGGLDDGSLRYKFFLTGGRREEDLDSQTASSSRAKEIDTDAILPEKAPQVSTTHYDLVTLNSGRRMDVASLVATESNVGLDARVVVLVCGPGGLADEVRFQVVCRARQGVLVDLIEEGFEW